MAIDFTDSLPQVSYTALFVLQGCAYVEVFLFFVGMLQKLRIRPPEGIQELREKLSTSGTVQHPKPFKVILESTM